MSSQRTIHDLPPNDRPREKLARLGAAALSEAELIAILLRTGRVGQNVLEVARGLLAEFGSLEAIARAPVAALAAFPGIGPAKAVQLAAAFGLGARLAAELFSRVALEDAAQVYAFLAPELRCQSRETVRLLLLDGARRLIRMEEVAHGTADRALVHAREVFSPALLHGATQVILVHHHPSGDPTPSAEDRLLTRRLREIGTLLEIPLIDHLIIGAPGAANGRGYFSFRELGLV